MRAMVTGRAMTPADLALLTGCGGDRAGGAGLVVAVVADGPGCPVLRVRFAGEWLGDLLLGSAADRDRVVDALRTGAVAVVTDR